MHRSVGDSVCSFYFIFFRFVFAFFWNILAPKKSNKTCFSFFFFFLWYQTIQMGSKMTDIVRTEQKKLELQYGFVYQFLKNNNKKDGDNEKEMEQVNEMMEQLVTNMIHLISNKLPISDDTLLLCWKFEQSKYTPTTIKNSRLFKCIHSVLTSLLQIPLKKMDFWWFQCFLFKSSVKCTSWFTAIAVVSLFFHENGCCVCVGVIRFGMRVMNLK